MLVIEHKVNTPKQRTITPYAEIDVHVGEYGGLVVKHDPEGRGTPVDEYLGESGHDKFFVDIKQNLDNVHFEMIVDAFGDRLLGIFDVPFPSCYFLSKTPIDFYGRLSEFELAPLRLTNRYWVDPLGEWTERMYRLLLYSVRVEAKAILACPSLHGKGIADAERVWKWVKESNSYVTDKVEGIVTKYPREFMEVWNG